MCPSKAWVLIQEGLTRPSLGAEGLLPLESPLDLLYGPTTWPEPMLQHGQKRRLLGSPVRVDDRVPLIWVATVPPGVVVQDVGVDSSEMRLPSELIEVVVSIDVPRVSTMSYDVRVVGVVPEELRKPHSGILD